MIGIDLENDCVKMHNVLIHILCAATSVIRWWQYFEICSTSFLVHVVSYRLICLTVIVTEGKQSRVVIFIMHAMLYHLSYCMFYVSIGHPYSNTNLYSTLCLLYHHTNTLRRFPL